MTPTRHSLCVCSRPSVSLRDWFQNPLRILKPKDAHIPWAALPLWFCTRRCTQLWIVWYWMYFWKKKSAHPWTCAVARGSAIQGHIRTLGVLRRRKHPRHAFLLYLSLFAYLCIGSLPAYLDGLDFYCLYSIPRHNEYNWLNSSWITGLLFFYKAVISNHTIFEHIHKIYLLVNFQI